MLGHFTFITRKSLSPRPNNQRVGLEFTTNDFIGNFKYHVEVVIHLWIMGLPSLESFMVAESILHILVTAAAGCKIKAQLN